MNSSFYNTIVDSKNNKEFFGWASGSIYLIGQIIQLLYCYKTKDLFNIPYLKLILFILSNLLMIGYGYFSNSDSIYIMFTCILIFNVFLLCQKIYYSNHYPNSMYYSLG
jgi:uncharacterized protein with PQ loop repeat